MVVHSKIYIPKWGFLFCTFLLLTTFGCATSYLNTRVRALYSPIYCATIPNYVEGMSQVVKVGEDMITLGRVWSRRERKVRFRQTLSDVYDGNTRAARQWEWVAVDTLDMGMGQQAAFLGALMYTGIEGSIIHLSYRETGETEYFSPQRVDLRYDLADGREIEFRSLNIRVENATSTSIEFTVTDDGGLPWLPNPAELMYACNGTPITYPEQ